MSSQLTRYPNRCISRGGPAARFGFAGVQYDRAGNPLSLSVPVTAECVQWSAVSSMFTARGD